MKQQNSKIKGKGAGPEKAWPFWFWETLISPLWWKNLGEINRKRGGVYDPERFIFTDENGNQYIVNPGTGLEQMTALDGDVLKVDTAGIHWVNNQQTGHKDITFTRDSFSRITQIQDPNGNLYHYTYDSNGNLSTYQDPAGAAAGKKDTYAYNSTHGLLNILDPLGDTPIRNDYDASGRLIDTIDAFGNKITYAYNLTANSEAVTNRLNQPTSYVYDNEGNIIQETDPLGNVTKYTYSQDGLNNKTSELLPGNSSPTTYVYADPNNPRSVTKQTDPLGHSTSYTYDALGHLLVTTDANGNVTTNSYDTHGNLVRTVDALGHSTSYNYDANGNLLQQTDPVGIETAYGYDSSGDQLAVTAAMGLAEQQVTTYSYDANGNRLTETKLNPSGSGNQVTSYTYDASNRLVETSYPDSTNTQTVYDALGHVVSSIDQKSRQTLDLYDAMGRTTTIQYPDTRKSVYSYDANGNRVGDDEYGTDSTLHSTQTYYDQDNRAIKVIYPDESTTSTVYNGQGAVTESVDENGHATSNCYDQAGRRIKTVAGYNSLIPMETDYTYDNNGNQTMLTVAGTLQSTTEYDALNRATTVLYPQPGGAMVMPSVTLYDADGRKTGQIDQAGNMTSYSYDGQARLTSVTDAMGHATRYTYDQLGNELTQTDANGHVTSYTYDVMNRRKSRILPGGQQETYDSYDATGNLTHKTTFDDKGIGYSYTLLDDKLQTETFNEGSINFSYDGFLRRYSMTDVSGTTTYNYDPRDRLVAKNNPTYGNLSYLYDAHGSVTQTTSSNQNGTDVNYYYDALNRPATVVDSHRSQDLTTIYNYDSFGNLANVTKPNGEAVTYSYDVLNRLNSMSVSLTSNSSLLTSYAYTLGPSGNRTNVSELSGRAVTWTYDALYRLTSETISNDPVALNNGTIGYSYDPVGNRLERASNVNVSKIPAQNFNGQYDANDRLGGTNTYDNDGNTLSDGENTYQYDTLDRLITVTSDDSAVSYVYDGDGNKVQETVNGLARSFLVDSNNLTGYSQVLEVNQGSGINKVYTYGLNRISEDQIVSNNWQLDFYGYDGQGSVRYMTDINGSLANTYEYDSFGTTLWQNGTVPNVMLYDGEERSQSSGLYDLRARWMNPGIGRFVSMDSFEGLKDDPLSLHKFEFAVNNSVNKIDPTGHQYGSAISNLLKGVFSFSTKATVDASYDVIIYWIGGLVETRYIDGSRNWRSNNPGNLEYGPFTLSHGAIGTDRRFAIFPDEATGTDAAFTRLGTEPYISENVAKAIESWAPPIENDTAAYQSFVKGLTGFDATTPIKNLTDYEIEKLVQVIKIYEGWKPGTDKYSE